MSNAYYDERVQSLVVEALTASMGAGQWNGDIEGDAISDDRTWGVLQTNNEGDYWLAAEKTHTDAMNTARSCVMQQSSGAYAWWPLAIIDTEHGAIELVEVNVTITTSAVFRRQA